MENEDAPTAEISALATDSSNQDVRTTAPTALEEKMSAWKSGHDLARNAIWSRLGHYHILDFKHETNAYELWNRIKRFQKHLQRYSQHSSKASARRELLDIPFSYWPG